MMPLRLFFSLLADAPWAKTVSLGLLMVLTGLTDGVGLLLLVPLLALLQDHMASNTMAANNAVAQTFSSGFSALGLPVTLTAVLGIFLVLIVMRSLFQFQRERLSTRLQYQLVDQLRLRCFDALLHAEWRWLSARRQSDHANLLLNDINRVGSGLNFGLSLLATCTMMVAYLGTAVTLSWKMTALAVVSGGLVFYLLSGQRRRALGLGGDLSQANRGMQQVIQESLAGMKLSKILGNESRHGSSFAQVMGRLREKQMRFMVSSGLSRAFYQVGAAVLLAVFLYMGVSALQVPMAQLLILVLIFSRLIPQFSSAQQQYHHWLHSMPALQDTQQLLAQCRAHAEPRTSAGVSPFSGSDAISLQQASVTYDDRRKPALNKITLTIEPHTTTAVVGASGSGKSTLADAIMGLLTLDEGCLVVGNTVIEGNARVAWRHCVAYVPQEVFLFNDTIRNNLLWAQPGASDEELLSALRAAAADFVFALPHQLDTLVGDNGICLSGGERQRIALARALLRKPLLLILDEATSALDRENEYRVTEAIKRIHGKLTVIVIGHRLAALDYADQVVELVDGQLRLQKNINTKPEHKLPIDRRALDPSHL